MVAETDHAARLGASLVAADYRPRPALADPALALAPDAPLVHPGSKLVRHLEIARGPSPSRADVVVTGTWDMARQDPGFLGLESALALPDPDGGVTIHTATQDVFMDRRMVAMQSDLHPELVRVQQAGMGGAFGGRERITVQAHVALAALRLGRPVKATYRRPESFAAHAKRHPARVTLTLGADRDGGLVFARGEALLDGGAYGPDASSAVLGATCYYLAGPYRVPTVRITGDAVYTNNPVSGAMRGFGAPQACFAVESAMDLLARELGMDPVELRRRNALRPGDTFPTSWQLSCPAPLAEVIDACAALPLPVDDCEPGRGPAGPDPPGRFGFAVGAKHAMYGEGEPEWSVASVVVDHGREPDRPHVRRGVRAGAAGRADADHRRDAGRHACRGPGRFHRRRVRWRVIGQPPDLDVRLRRPPGCRRRRGGATRAGGPVLRHRPGAGAGRRRRAARTGAARLPEGRSRCGGHRGEGDLPCPAYRAGRPRHR